MTHNVKRKRIRKPYDKSKATLVSSTVVAKRQGVNFSSVVVCYKPSKVEQLKEFIDSLS
jgi:hypothetical protein